MNKLTVLLAACSSLIMACQPNYQDREQAIAVHDEIMPKMESFVQSSMKIDTLLLHMDSLHTANPDLDTLQLRKSLVELQEQIENSNDAMNQWMQEFEMDPEGNKETVERYFQQQKSKIDSVQIRYQNTEQAIQSQDILN